MTDQFRAICAELLEALKSWSPHGGGPLEYWEAEEEAGLIARAENALAQPEPKGPTDEDLLKLVPQALDDSLSGASRAMFQNSLSSASGIYKAFIIQELRFARAVLAKWGNQ